MGDYYKVKHGRKQICKWNKCSKMFGTKETLTKHQKLLNIPAAPFDICSKGHFQQAFVYQAELNSDIKSVYPTNCFLYESCEKKLHQKARFGEAYTKIA